MIKQPGKAKQIKRTWKKKTTNKWKPSKKRMEKQKKIKSMKPTVL